MKQIQETLFKDRVHARQSLSNLLRGDLYIVGRIWVRCMRAALVGARFSITPTVHAAPPPPEPKHPPPMGYRQLPLYQSPHYDYNDHEADKEKCPKANTPLLQEFLLPAVKGFRRDAQRSVCQVSCGCKSAWAQLRAEVAAHERNIKEFMRDPERLIMRQGVVILGAVTGTLLARNRGIPSKLFGASVGGFVAGALTFPEESDEAIREVLLRGGRVAVAVYNVVCSDTYVLQERMSCAEELPPPPPPRAPQRPLK